MSNKNAKRFFFVFFLFSFNANHFNEYLLTNFTLTELPPTHFLYIFEESNFNFTYCRAI